VEAPPDPASPKEVWRRWARALPPVGEDVARRVAGHVLHALDGVRGPVLGYLALPDEVDLGDLLARCGCLPRLADDGTMTLHLDDGSRERHGTGLDQPAGGLAVVDASSLAAVLVPGRLFDREGYRLGRGGGHYDRLLPQLAPGTPVLGVTTAGRVVPRLPREAHDRPMTQLVTEDGIQSVH
jgi:5-formyltetrahydrofolate cyclo-ligase